MVNRDCEIIRGQIRGHISEKTGDMKGYVKFCASRDEKGPNTVQDISLWTFELP